MKVISRKRKTKTPQKTSNLSKEAIGYIKKAVINILYEADMDGSLDLGEDLSISLFKNSSKHEVKKIKLLILLQ